MRAQDSDVACARAMAAVSDTTLTSAMRRCLRRGMVADVISMLPERVQPEMCSSSSDGKAVSWR